MVVQNSTFTGKSKITRLLSLLILMALCAIVSFINTLLFEFGSNYEFPWTYKLLVIFIILGIYSFTVWIRYQKNYNFVYFTDDDKQNLVFRFYHIKTFGKKYTTYKIPINLFQNFELVTEGSKKELLLYQKVQNNKIAKYPGISITGLSQEEITEIQKILTSYLPKN